MVRLRSGRVLCAICAVACLVAAMLGVASGSAAGRSPGATVATAPQGIATAEHAVAQYTQVQGPPAVPPLPRRPPRGKTVASVNCNVVACEPGLEGPIVAKLGWTHRLFSVDLTTGPSSFISAFNDAVASHPDYMDVNAIYPRGLVSSGIAQAKKLGIPIAWQTVITGTTPTPCFVCLPEFYGVGSLLADVALANAGAKTHIAAIYDPTLNGLVAVFHGIEKEVAKNGSGSSIGGIKVSIADTPTAINAAVVNYLQRNSDVKYVISTLDNLANGLPAALAQAGLSSRVKIILGQISQADVPIIKAGDVLAGVADEEEGFVFRTVDYYARLSEGIALSPARSHPAGWFQIVTPSNASKFATHLEPAGLAAAYYSAWHVG